MTKLEEMTIVSDTIEKLLHELQPKKDYIHIFYDKPLADNIFRYEKWDQEYFHIAPGEEYFIIYESHPYEADHILYAVNVTADSALTATYELMDLISRKF